MDSQRIKVDGVMHSNPVTLHISPRLPNISPGQQKQEQIHATLTNVHMFLPVELNLICALVLLNTPA